MTDLTDDQREILAAFAAATEPVDWYDIVLQLAPEPGMTWGNPRGQRQDYRAWLRRRDHLTAEAMLLFRDGLLLEFPDGPVDMTVITDAGRSAFDAVTAAAKRV